METRGRIFAQIVRRRHPLAPAPIWFLNKIRNFEIMSRVERQLEVPDYLEMTGLLNGFQNSPVASIRLR
jgi:hypothetical protein